MSDLYYYKDLALRKLSKTAEADKILESMVSIHERMQTNLMDSYAKFGDANLNVQQSNLAYFSGLINLMQENRSEAGKQFNEALRLYPGNIWAKWMTKGIFF